MGEINRFSTEDLPSDRRFQGWCERFRDSFGEATLSSRASREFFASSEWWSEANITLYHLHVDAQDIDVPPRQTSRSNSTVHAVFPLAGQFHIEQGGRDFRLVPGEWGVYDPKLGFRSTTDHPVELLVLAAPYEAALGHGLTLDRCATQRFSSKSGSAYLARTYLTTLLQEKEALHQVSRCEFAALAAHLIRLSLIENVRRHSEINIREMLRARVEAFVLRNLRNPELSVEMISRTHHCSKRYVHKLFSEGESISDYIRRARLEQCFRDLSNPDLARLSITEIAFSWGFQLQSHFSRSFRKHFDMSPSDCRLSIASPNRPRNALSS